MASASISNYLVLSDDLATGGQPTAPQFAELARQGFEVVINLAVGEGPYALPGEEVLVREHGMAYVHIPVAWERPEQADLEAFFTAMEANKGKKMFIHCAANMRVSVFMALYRILELGWDLERALQDVHRIWTPNQVWQQFMLDMLGASQSADRPLLA